MIYKLFLCLFLTVLPGNAPDSKDAVAAVRKAYAAAKQAIAENTREGIPRNDIVTTYHYNIPACGETTEVLHAWCNLKINEEDWNCYYPPFFITRKYNVAVRKYYEEYLFDPENGNLLFVFIQGDDPDTGEKNEERYYYDNGKLVQEMIKGKRTLDDERIVRHAKMLFNALKTPIELSAN